MKAVDIVNELLEANLHVPSLLANLKHRYYAKFGQQVTDKYQNKVTDLVDPEKIAEWREIEQQFAQADDETKKALWARYVVWMRTPL